ncbi:major facilitator superfamily domain-containing protein [Aspergillus coremiiformis]|uniref:Major facilitator superfamily domain-containing protein n=1 Tax=Aspergillus coremiiformis TaxID=138285 RepID=A0A5N6Z3X4_9EURO|nr:major facilitator superfamily domain-containing protein [Aspergillus coremiiformis]
MVTETENEDAAQAEGGWAQKPSFYDQKSARQVMDKIITLNFAIMAAGLNDAATGVLIPYIQPTYQIGLLAVSFIYLANFAGWLCACFANIHVCSRLGTGGTVVLGAAIQCLGNALIFGHPPYPLFMAAFFFTGMGIAFQNAQANAFIITVKNAHWWLGILHAIYGAGTIIAPLIANTIASQTPEWHRYYLITSCVGVVNTLLLAWTFRRGLFRPNVLNTQETAGSQLKATLTNRSVWIINGFFFLYSGAEVVSGGWIVQFIVSVRHGDPKKVGYIASGFWTGFTVGRVVLADITHKFGERRMVFVYLVLALGMQLIFWFVPNILVNAIAVFVLGFFIGPFYPVGLYLLTEIVPQELHLGAIGFVASLGQAGSAAFPFMTGAIASKAGVQVLQPIMVGLLVGIGVFWAFIPKQGTIRLEGETENDRLVES